MTETFQILILLLAVICLVGLVAKRLQIPPAILLVITGVVLALIPGLPSLQLAPDLVLLLVLPPVIYWDAVKMSWKEFRFNLRPIALLAIGCVVFTTVAVAAATHWLLGFPWAVGFVLGAIVSPPDAVAPLAIAQRMQLPRRLIVVLEGEGLANDATALVLYRFAVMAVSAGSFSFVEASGTFVAIVAGEIVWGIGVGWLMLRLRRWVRDPGIEIMLSILTPFMAYWPPEQLGGSGVLATLATGLYVSWNGLRLIPAATRLPGAVFWDFLTYLIEGMVFLITGLQARTLLPSIRHYTLAEIAMAALVVCAVVIVTRFIWMYPATYVPRWLFPAIRRKDPYPPWQHPTLLGFTGIRGIVSLAAALAIPFTVADGSPFPHRDLILDSRLRRHFRDPGRRRLDAANGGPGAGSRRRWTARADGRAGGGVQGPQACRRGGDRTARVARQEPQASRAGGPADARSSAQPARRRRPSQGGQRAPQEARGAWR